MSEPNTAGQCLGCGELWVSGHVCNKPSAQAKVCELCGAPAELRENVWRHAGKPYENQQFLCEKYGYPIPVTERNDANGKHQPQYCWNVPAELRTPNEKHCGDCEVSIARITPTAAQEMLSDPKATEEQLEWAHAQTYEVASQGEVHCNCGAGDDAYLARHSDKCCFAHPTPQGKPSAREWRNQHQAWEPQQGMYSGTQVEEMLTAYSQQLFSQQAAQLHAAYKVKIDYERYIGAEILKQKEAVESQLADRENTNRELNRRNQSLEVELNRKTDRKIWHGYSDAAMSIFRQLVEKLEAAGCSFAHFNVKNDRAETAERLVGRLRKALQSCVHEAGRRYKISWELSADGKDLYRCGEARIAKELRTFIEQQAAKSEEPK